MGEMGEVMSNFELAWSVFGSPAGHIIIEADDLPDDLTETELCALAYRKIDEQIQITAGPNWDSLIEFVKWAKESKGRAAE